MRVLWHLSHHSSSRPDGWSGAPDEARWIREELTPAVINSCHLLGIAIFLVDGDGDSPDNPTGDHPEFHQDYDAFVAPHYESDTHDTHLGPWGNQHRGGWFWGRATASTTAPRDDVLGDIFARRYRDLLQRKPGGPDEHEAWETVNVTNYYGFRLTSAATPGILVELGVGALGDPLDDATWLRAHVQDIADVLALTLAEFGGVPVMTAGDQMRPYYAGAVSIYPVFYAPQPVIEPDYQYYPPPSDTPDAMCLLPIDPNHQLHLACRFDYPAAAGDPAWRALEMENTFNHEIGGHGFKAYLQHRAPNVDWDAKYWTFRGFPGTYASAAAANNPYVWANDPNESWGEAGGAALSGHWSKPEKTQNWGITVDAMAMRSFLKQCMYEAWPQLKEVFVSKFISDDIAATMDANGNAVILTPIPAIAGFVSGQKASAQTERIGVPDNQAVLPKIASAINEDTTKPVNGDGRFYVRSVVRGDPQHSQTAYFKVSAWQ